MQKKPLFRRLLTVETLSSGVLGALATYLVAALVKVAPTRVPLWLVLAGIASCVILVRIMQVALDRHHRAQQRLDRIEQTMAKIASGDHADS
jgi:hypothetical protein